MPRHALVGESTRVLRVAPDNRRSRLVAWWRSATQGRRRFLTRLGLSFAVAFVAVTGLVMATVGDQPPEVRATLPDKPEEPPGGGSGAFLDQEPLSPAATAVGPAEGAGRAGARPEPMIVERIPAAPGSAPPAAAPGPPAAPKGVPSAPAAGSGSPPVPSHGETKPPVETSGNQPQDESRPEDESPGDLCGGGGVYDPETNGCRAPDEGPVTVCDDRLKYSETEEMCREYDPPQKRDDDPVSDSDDGSSSRDMGGGKGTGLVGVDQ